MSDNSETQNVTAWVPEQMVEEIDEYEAEMGYGSRSKAAAGLLRTGLQAHETDALARADGGERRDDPDVVFLGMGVSGLSTIFAFLLWTAGNAALLGWTMMFGLTTALLALVYGTQWSVTSVLERRALR